jgi:MarR family
MSKTKTPPAKQAILEVLKVEPQATVAQIAVSAGIGRSTAGKLLAQLESDGEVRRTEGGRDGARRLPDRFVLASAEPKATKNSTPKRRASAKGEPSESAKPKTPDDRLKPGQLDGLVLAYLKKNADSGPHGPTTVAKALERSSGAVGNCLVRLTKDKKVRQDSDKPRRYSLAA